MLTTKQVKEYRLKAAAMLDAARIAVTDAEKENIEVTDYGLGNLDEIGTQIFVYVNTERVCAKELIMLPYQTCPEHRHPDGADYKGKEETFRCRKGTVYLYVEGEPAEKIKAKIPDSVITVFHEVVLTEGMQYTLMPDTLHWFQAGAEGAIVSEFSTKSRDNADVFTDPAILRSPVIKD